MIFVEAASILIFLFNIHLRWIIKTYDILLALYVIFLIICLACLNEITNGCIDCHFIAQGFFQDYFSTLLTIILIGLVYFLIFRSMIFKKSFSKDSPNTTSAKI